MTLETYSFTFLLLFPGLWSPISSSSHDIDKEQAGMPTYGSMGYDFEIVDGGLTFKWRVEANGSHDMEMSSRSDGYVAVGFCDPMTRTTGDGMENVSQYAFA